MAGQSTGNIVKISVVRTAERLGAGVVICLERGADLHIAQLMPLPLTVSCFSKIRTGFTFLIPAHLGSPGQRAVKRVCTHCGLLAERLLQLWEILLKERRVYRHTVYTRAYVGLFVKCQKSREAESRSFHQSVLRFIFRFRQA